MTDRITADGKFFAIDRQRFRFQGVTYGTFAPRDDGARYPEREIVKQDFAQLRSAGFTVVRTYTCPPEDLLELAADWDLRVLAGAFYPDWRYLLGGSRRDRQRVARAAAEEVRQAAHRLAGNPQVLGLSIGNEVPADALRWYGTDAIARVLRELVEIAHDQDPELLVTYGNYPTAEYLHVDGLDFLTFNVFLEHRTELRRYLTRLQHLAGARPLVIGELGIDAGATPAGERHQAEVLDWQLATVLERGAAGACVFSFTDDWVVGDDRVENWHFGLTRADRSVRPAFGVAAAWNNRTCKDLSAEWQSISVVVCAYNAEATIDECLSHACALDYPNLEVIVVDDGSTDATAELARHHPRARLLQVPHGGLSVARNTGFQAASGAVVAYLDADAYPSPEWPYYLALGLDAPTVGGVGGPNVPPPTDGPGAQVVARAPGGPVHVLLADDRAEHVPGCNMAFRKEVLEQVGGFDAVFTTAGDDLDLCWRVLDEGWEIGFHPAALVWHHRRGTLRGYLRQQRGYGRSEALVETRHPERFTPVGTARWRGRIYTSLIPLVVRSRVYRGAFGAAAYQSAHRRDGYLIDLAHQAGLPISALLMPTAALAAVDPVLGLPGAAGGAFCIALFLVDLVRAPDGPARHFRFRLALHQLLQPLVRTWARARHQRGARQTIQAGPQLPAQLRRLPRGVLLLHEDRPRAALAAAVVHALRRVGIRAVPASGWDDHDGRLYLSPLVRGELQTSSHPVGYVQVRVRCRPRLLPLLAVFVCAAVAALVSPELALLVAAAAVIAVGAGLAHGRTVLRRVIRERAS
jgi:O-antigen biosynthesis protein